MLQYNIIRRKTTTLHDVKMTYCKEWYVKYTVIRFFFVAKTFSYTENIRKYLTEYNFTAKIFLMTVRQRPHTSTSLVAAAFISLYSW